MRNMGLFLEGEQGSLGAADPDRKPAANGDAARHALQPPGGPATVALARV
jgi:hypothetical protein